jgi:hypothetical protein
MASSLVDAFTPAEREALAKFKADYLQKSLEEAAGDPSGVSKLEIWGVPVAQEGPRTDVIIVKFLRAKFVRLQAS